MKHSYDIGELKMKRLINIESVKRCIENGINTASEIGKTLNFSCSSIFSFCKRNNIKLCKKQSGGKNCINMTGQKLKNGVEILERVQSDKELSTSRSKLAKWKCKCPCGKIFESVGADIRTNRIKTCGCRISIKTKRNWQGGKFVSKKYWQVLNNNASQRKLVVSVNIDYLDLLLEKQNFKCALSDVDLIFNSSSLLHTASLDRIDSSIGYIEGNVQWVHKHINFMKKDYKNEYFIELCRKVAFKNEKSPRVE